jgi:hypothetical protein
LWNRKEIVYLKSPGHQKIKEMKEARKTSFQQQGNAG